MKLFNPIALAETAETTGLSEKLDNVLDSLVAFATDFAMKLVAALFVLIIGKCIIKWALKVIRNSKVAKKADPSVARFLFNALSITLNILLVISVIAILGVPMTSVITLLASAGVAIGLALQGALSNLAGGIMILIFRPFRLDDYIEVGSFGGTVKDIGIFYTTLHTGDNRTVTIPNGTVMSEEIVNYSVNATRRVDLVFSVAYGTDVERVCSILLEEAGKHELTLKDPAPFARLTKQNESSLDFTLRVWAKKDDYWTVHFDLLESLNKRFVEEGIEIPFPQLDVHVDNQK